MVTPEGKMVPVTLMLDLERHSKLKTVSKSTRISMSELVRISLDGLMEALGDPENPDRDALAALLAGENPAEVKSSKRSRKK